MFPRVTIPRTTLRKRGQGRGQGSVPPTPTPGRPATSAQPPSGQAQSSS